jgi:hypothetical protein
MASRSFGICLRIAFVSMLGTWLAGCGLPPAVAIMSTAADGFSFIATGKSFSDIALSAMTDKDCAVFRIVTNNEICREAVDDKRPARVIVSSDVGTGFAAVDESSDSFYMLRHGDMALDTTVAELSTSRALLKGFTEGTELFALVQDDGTLEVFAHDVRRTRDRSNMRLIVRLSGYAAAPDSFSTLRLNGANVAVEDIIV